MEQVRSRREGASPLSPPRREGAGGGRGRPGSGVAALCLPYWAGESGWGEEDNPGVGWAKWAVALGDFLIFVILLFSFFLLFFIAIK
jgi:hypothetical protein